MSAVITPEAAEQTQGKVARRLGRDLLLASAHHDNSWAKAHLNLELFDTRAVDPGLRLIPDNFSEVAYGSSRMLYAWDIPAWIEGRPYVDASYTCSCPALELAAMGYEEIIAISPECGSFYHDLFGTQEIPFVWGKSLIHTIQPDVDLKEYGVNYTQANENGLLITYRLGEEKGREFLSQFALAASTQLY